MARWISTARTPRRSERRSLAFAYKTIRYAGTRQNGGDRRERGAAARRNRGAPTTTGSAEPAFGGGVPSQERDAMSDRIFTAGADPGRVLDRPCSGRAPRVRLCV